MFENSEKYFNFINTKLEGFFENQKPYIFCKKGCAKCCHNAQFPFSCLEAYYLSTHIKTLNSDIQEIITQNIININRKKSEFKGEKFMYDCPFLIDEVCCVYDYRGIICRSFGLIENKKDGVSGVPFCYELGLNYSNVFDFEKNKITKEKWNASGIKIEPSGFNIGYEFLTSEKFERAYKIKFGEKKPLIDWFCDVF